MLKCTEPASQLAVKITLDPLFLTTSLNWFPTQTEKLKVSQLTHATVTTPTPRCSINVIKAKMWATLMFEDYFLWRWKEDSPETKPWSTIICYYDWSLFQALARVTHRQTNDNISISQYSDTRGWGWETSQLLMLAMAGEQRGETQSPIWLYLVARVSRVTCHKETSWHSAL